MKKMKKTFVMIFSVFVFLLMLNHVLAITGSIGNARMILQVQTGEEIEKYVLVKNVNEVPVDINLSASGDLADSVNIKDKQFKLNAGEEKKAVFTIKANKPGTTETQINVAFTPEEGHGVGLSSTVIVVASGEEVTDNGGILGWLTGGKNSTSGNVTGNSIIINNQVSVINNPVSIGLLSTTIILALFIILLAIYSGKVRKKKERELNQKRKVKQGE